MMIAILSIIASGILWRMRGIGISGSKFAFAIIQSTAFYNHPAFAFLFMGWIVLGEIWGWKPKLIKDNREWLKCSGMGLMIGGLGAIAVPLSTYLHIKYGEPTSPNNPKQYQLFGKTIVPFDWTGAWNEVYFGMIFSIIVQGISQWQ